MRLYPILFYLLLVSPSWLTAQVAVNSNSTSPHPSAMLDVSSSNRGLLMPRMSSSNRIAISSPASGLSVYDTDTKSFWFWDGQLWKEQATGNSNVWGSNGTHIYNTNSGNVGIGVTNPGFPLNFSNNVGDKIALWGNTGNHYGLGIQSGLLQIHSDQASSDIAFGFGQSSNFTEVMRIKGNGGVGIGTSNPYGRVQITHTSINSPTLTLFEINPGDYARLQFQNASGNKFWHVAGLINNANDAASKLNFYHSVNGDIMSISGNGNVGIGTNQPDPKALLELNATGKGLLIPRMTETERSVITNPPKSLLIYQTNGEEGFYYNRGTSASPNWTQLGNNDVQFKNAQVFTSNGTFNVPAGVTRVKIQAWGGGGGGGSTTYWGYSTTWTSNGISSSGGGGGGGGYAEGVFAVSNSGEFEITIGQGGTGATGVYGLGESQNNATDGGSTIVNYKIAGFSFPRLSATGGKRAQFKLPGRGGWGSGGYLNTTLGDGGFGGEIMEVMEPGDLVSAKGMVYPANGETGGNGGGGAGVGRMSIPGGGGGGGIGGGIGKGIPANPPSQQVVLDMSYADALPNSGAGGGGGVYYSDSSNQPYVNGGNGAAGKVIIYW